MIFVVLVIIPQEKGTVFIAILKLSLNNKNMSKQLAPL